MLKVFRVICIISAIAYTLPAYAEFDTFRFGGDDFAPFAYMNNGKVTGLSVDILRIILKELQIPDTIKIYPWARVYRMALKNKNTLIFTVARTEERESLFKWLGPIAPGEMSLYKLKRRKDIKINNFEDAKRYITGTIIGYAVEKDLLDMGFEHGKNLDSVSTDIQNFERLYINRIDLITSSDFVVAHTVKGTKYSLDDFEKVLVIDDKYDFYYAFNKETDDEIVNRFQRVLDAMRADGRYDNIVNEYLH
jgi:polar amino acid transport system substrate-binding protein